jgi:hypothetical protein
MAREKHLVDVFITRFCVQATETVYHHWYTPKKVKNLTVTVREFNKRIVNTN